jgi:signal transduction histidine kinase
VIPPSSPFVELFRHFISSDDGLQFLLRTLEDLPMAMVLYDVSAPDPEVLYVNRVARPVSVEVGAGEAGQLAPEVFPGSGWEQERWVREATAKGEPIHVSEYETGDQRVWEADIYPVGDSRHPTYILVMGIDVSESVRARREAERERTEQEAALRDTASRMAALEKVKSDFLNLASHELRGPLAVLRGYLAMLSDGSLGDLPPSVRSVLPVLNAKASQMAMLITQMLEAARLEDSQLQLKLEPLEMRTLVRQAVDTMGQLTAPGQSILLEGANQEILLVADAGRVETIIVNLLDNALKYSPGAGGVRVWVVADTASVTIKVADRGMGIAAEDVPRLFSRFGRLVTAENSHIPGTGLGLYLSRELARMHGGDITVSSVKGEGSVFSLTLPLAGPTA